MSRKYDTVSFIELVKSKPCIWDKNSEDYKNKCLKYKSWNEIAEHLDGEYVNMSKANRRRTSVMLRTKWARIKGSFNRSLRGKQSLRLGKRPYMYSRHLRFLLKNSGTCDLTIDLNKENTEDVEEESEPSKPTSPEPCTPLASTVTHINSDETTKDCMRQSTARNKRYLDEDEDEDENDIFAELKKPKLIDRTDHELVLLSCLPYMSDMTETELLDFQMDTLSTLKRIKDKRNYL